MRRVTKRRLRLLLRLVLLGMLVGIAYASVTGFVFGLPVLSRSLVSAIDGVLITVPIVAIEVFLLRSRWGRPLQQAPFLVTFGVKWLVYATVITAVVVGGPGARVVGLPPDRAPLEDPFVRLALVFSIAATVVFLFVLELRQIVGPRSLRNIVLGRYHRPRAEERFFLFVDIAGSTSLAERLGPAAVYQYVGDELVVTWPVREARADARPIACFFGIAAALDAAAPKFERDFDVAPRVRAALHAGDVIIGEIGETKRDIVFHGDVMNTAARLEQATRDLDRCFLVSADALDRLGRLDRYALEPLGRQTLRGRAAPVDVWAVAERG